MTTQTTFIIGRQMARHLREVHTGGNWSTCSFNEVLRDITVDELNNNSFSTNTILTLVYHTHYYVAVLGKVARGGALDAKDELSFVHPPLTEGQQLEELVNLILTTAEQTAAALECLSDSQFSDYFTDQKYGSWFRNAMGIIEHLHYHLGQIVLLKQLIRKSKT